MGIEDKKSGSETPSPGSMSELLKSAGIEVPPERVEVLDRYREALWAWNEKLNLTRHTTLEKFVTRDVVDSDQLTRLLSKRERVLDVGTGGGVPGVVMAILRPDLRVSLCESTGKKARAAEEIVRELGLALSVYATRAEEVLAIRTFDTLVVRAVAPLAKLLKWFSGSWGAFEQLLVIKGKSWVEERGEARHLGLLRGRDLRVAARYQTPGTGAENVILQVRPKGRLDLGAHP
jgi:16S rRNA (guanine527-N7)-methyltransferase